VRDALEAFTAIERLAGADKYKCEKCKQPVVAEKQFTIHDAPHVLTVHLKRFTPMGRKLTHAVKYGEHISLARYMSAGQVRLVLDLSWYLWLTLVCVL
jgi:ubiquitin carboxyl-terminal hydrolase 36/42